MLRSAVPAAATTPRRGWLLVALTFCHTVNDFYALLLAPLLPVLREAFQLTYAQAGAIPFVSTFVSAVLQPLLGYLADRRRQRRRLLITGFLLLAGGMGLLAHSGSYAGLLLGALVLGLGLSTYHPQSATFLAHYFTTQRGWAQGIHGIGNGLGFILAPVVVAGLVERLGLRPALWLLAGPALLAVGVIVFALREPEVQGARGLLAGLTWPLAGLTAINGLALAVGTGFQTWLPAFYRSIGQSLLAAGALTAVMSVATLVAQPLGGTLSDRFGRRAVVVGALLGMGGCLLLFALAPALWLLLLASVLFGFWGSLMPPVSMVYASELAAGQRTGMAVGVVWGLGTAMAAVAPPVVGLLVDLWGFRGAFLALAGLAVLGGLAARWLPR
jgi:FSR family fosmidomycin resistance protein-like MFS transporter